ncbi:hypothetical protein EJ05DRAFT_498122 [Pseudovirgaria hyperparasitica]|uniref:Uncharacterized protein n=1 Tax=Pseudovirgaria hyperparasitica TaxID=470096 RepID=A0A6A6WBE0_9PEZI|nr:uncharacterized protein EJ05DRAFT_498122 [Pseudovirgaria hyperparasitica]KAF2760152.1 hypothetical protein EJ05DRAFT_498122 [Pseudovirgaria hyperparasitica]
MEWAQARIGQFGELGSDSGLGSRVCLWGRREVSKDDENDDEDDDDDGNDDDAEDEQAWQSVMDGSGVDKNKRTEPVKSGPEVQESRSPETRE